MYWSESVEGELPAVKQSSCIDKTSPCFVLVSYYMLKSWAVKGYLMLWFHWWPDCSYGWLWSLPDTISVRKKGSLLQCSDTKSRFNHFQIHLLSNMNYENEKAIRSIFPKTGVVRIFLDTTQHQPSQLCIQEADHRAWVDGDNWKWT